MPQKRKRKRTRVKPGPFLVLAVVVVFVTGLWFSPLTALSKASVVGAKPMHQADIDKILGSLNKTPWTQVRNREVESQVQQIQAVDRASYSQNIFGRGNLKLTYRVPVARIKAGRPIGLDAKGVMFETDVVSEDLPTVMRPDAAKDLPLTLVSGFPSGSVAELAVKARQMNPKDKLIIWFNKEGSLCLNIDTGLVILGSCEDLDAKLHALKEILDQQPGLLGKVESLNLTEPDHPAKTYKKQRE